MNQAVAAVDERRQWERLMAMAKIGAIAGDGVNRACLTELDRQARRLLIAWAGEIGAEVSIDAAANLWLRRQGADPQAAPVVTGSHMDTQPNGGRFDGIYGVIAGLEALAALHRSGTVLRRPVEVVAWTNEEGGRFAPGCMGSMSWSGFRRIEDFADVVDPDGVRFADALDSHLASETDLPDRLLGGGRTPMSRRTSSRDRGWKPRGWISGSSPAFRAAAGSPLPLPARPRTPAPRRWRCGTMRCRTWCARSLH